MDEYHSYLFFFMLGMRPNATNYHGDLKLQFWNFSLKHNNSAETVTCFS